MQAREYATAHHLLFLLLLLLLRAVAMAMIVR